MDSILDSVKRALGVEVDDTSFDVELILHINTTLSTLNQLGVGPALGFAIEDDSATWVDFLGADPRFNDVKQYTYLRVRMIFDVPATSPLIQAVRETISELEWRINVRREGDAWVQPVLQTQIEPEVVIVPVTQAWYSE